MQNVWFQIMRQLVNVMLDFWPILMQSKDVQDAHKILIVIQERLVKPIYVLHHVHKTLIVLTMRPVTLIAAHVQKLFARTLWTGSRSSNVEQMESVLWQIMLQLVNVRQDFNQILMQLPDVQNVLKTLIVRMDKHARVMNVSPHVLRTLTAMQQKNALTTCVRRLLVITFLVDLMHNVQLQVTLHHVHVTKGIKQLQLQMMDVVSTFQYK